MGMYFQLSSLASFLVQPIVWLVAGLITLLFLKSPSWIRRVRWGVVALALLFTNPALYHFAMCQWERPPLAISDLEAPYDDAIVPGGFSRLWAVPADRLHLNGDGNRFSHAVELFHLGKVRRIVFVSGGTTSSFPPAGEAELAARTAVRFGIPAEAVVALTTSRNTGENASECLAFYRNSGGPPSRLLLVTSAIHARRAEASFRKVGLAVDVFPTDHRTGPGGSERVWTFGNTLLPDFATLLSWGTLFREILGLLVYRVLDWA
jgi:uncharacterized SAM-binding protein YcdF (DUF218 family)